MSKKQKLRDGSYLEAWLWQHVMRKKVVWLELYDGQLSLSFVRGGCSYVYPYYKIGQVKLNKNGTTGGNASYIKYWKPYKRGVNYRRPKMAANMSSGPNAGLNNLEQHILDLMNQTVGSSLATRFQMVTTTSAVTGTVGTQTAKQKVDQLNAQMMRKHKANLRGGNVQITGVPF